MSQKTIASVRVRLYGEELQRSYEGARVAGVGLVCQVLNVRTIRVPSPYTCLPLDPG